MAKKTLMVVAAWALVMVGGGMLARAQQTATPFEHAHFSRPELDGARHAAAAAISVTKAATIWNRACAALILRADVDVSRVFSAIIGGYPERPRHSDGSEVTRQHQLDAVRFHRDRALADSLPAALACVMRMPPRPRQFPAESAAHLRDAIRFLQGVDTSLPYANPTPQALRALGGVVQTDPAVVGPHGVYWDAAAQAHWMGHYSRDMLTAALPYLEGAKRQVAINILALYRDTRLWQLDSEGKIAGIVDDPADRFCSILYAADTLSDAMDNPKPPLNEIYFAMSLQIMELVPADVRPLIQAHGDLWRRTGAAMWGIFRENEPLRKRCNQ